MSVARPGCWPVRLLAWLRGGHCCGLDLQCLARRFLFLRRGLHLSVLVLVVRVRWAILCPASRLGVSSVGVSGCCVPSGDPCLCSGSHSGLLYLVLVGWSWVCGVGWYGPFGLSWGARCGGLGPLGVGGSGLSPSLPCLFGSWVGWYGPSGLAWFFSTPSVAGGWCGAMPRRRVRLGCLFLPRCANRMHSCWRSPAALAAGCTVSRRSVALVFAGSVVLQEPRVVHGAGGVVVFVPLAVRAVLLLAVLG